MLELPRRDQVTAQLGKRTSSPPPLGEKGRVQPLPSRAQRKDPWSDGLDGLGGEKPTGIQASPRRFPPRGCSLGASLQRLPQNEGKKGVYLGEVPLEPSPPHVSWHSPGMCRLS